MSTIGERLKKAREKSKLTQLEAAAKLGISNGTLSGYERNYRDPDTNGLNKMADLYEVSVDYLLGRTNVSRYEDQDPFKELGFLEGEELHFKDDWNNLPYADKLSIAKQIKVMRRMAEEEAKKNRNNQTPK